MQQVLLFAGWNNWQEIKRGARTNCHRDRLLKCSRISLLSVNVALVFGEGIFRTINCTLLHLNILLNCSPPKTLRWQTFWRHILQGIYIHIFYVQTSSSNNQHIEKLTSYQCFSLWSSTQFLTQKHWLTCNMYALHDNIIILLGNNEYPCLFFVLKSFYWLFSAIFDAN